MKAKSFSLKIYLTCLNFLLISLEELDEVYPSDEDVLKFGCSVSKPTFVDVGPRTFIHSSFHPFFY